MPKRKLVIVGIALAAIAYAAVSLIFRFDDTRVEAEQVLRQHEPLVAEVGEIVDLDLVRRVVVGTPENYRQYTFVIRGEQGNATVLIRVSPQSDGGNAYEISIERVSRP